MKIFFNQTHTISFMPKHAPLSSARKGWINLTVMYCGICRTDAKIWQEGHRDIRFPLIPGHEIVAEKDKKRYVVWPGIVCGNCQYCRNKRENLCDSMRIIGFHHDGGFATEITVPKTSLLPLPTMLQPMLAAFAEPMGCVIQAINKLSLQKDEPVLIIGAGTMGILAALYTKALGAQPTIIENKQSKIVKSNNITIKKPIEIVKHPKNREFTCGLNACSDPAAFCMAITHLRKGGRLVHFSGLKTGENISTNLINPIHYRELTVMGSYGLTKENMETGVAFIVQNASIIELLIEQVICPEEIENIIPLVLEGIPYKYIIDFTNISHDLD